MKGMLKSKRFIAFSVSVILFVILLFTTNYSPMELSGALSALSFIYITIRKSNINEG